MITGDEISVIYEGQLSNKDTSTVKALKVVDDFHKKNQLEVRKAYGGSTESDLKYHYHKK